MKNDLTNLNALYVRAASLNIQLKPYAFNCDIERQNDTIYFSITMDMDKFCFEVTKLLDQIEIEKTKLGKVLYENR
jgi:hypothetical protein